MIKLEKTSKEYRKFGAALALAFIFVGSMLLWKGHLSGTKVFYSWSVITLLFVILKPSIMKYPILVFMGIGWFNTKLILLLSFFLIVTPFGLIMRISGKDPLDQKWKTGKDSYWLVPENSETSPKHIEKPF
ncbi:MAG: hypothetical protein A2161_01115 [Candidatus Schekmanbacteria bacterium RBG_13_48_7]|uniref:SxtJ n=1 Tax=Candidatus Schekmanbacteria bacterium RBG_13_48_7 TaxID=1817878 RepID=A0A1F7S0N4_9BACT|nr:MAG: hypothetical protein A2161_01115 [Candidatus Schekmanbacteria bacterium RBG_13_48_7]